MTTVQRRRGRTARIWRMHETTDRRGNKTITARSDDPIEVSAWGIPQRSSVASVPGQQQINIIRIGITTELPPGVGTFSRVEWEDSMWDVASPPAYHHGTRHVRHWSVDLRERPGGATKDTIPEATDG